MWCVAGVSVAIVLRGVCGLCVDSLGEVGDGGDVGVFGVCVCVYVACGEVSASSNCGGFVLCL